jgi:hypothetical protein
VINKSNSLIDTKINSFKNVYNKELEIVKNNNSQILNPGILFVNKGFPISIDKEFITANPKIQNALSEIKNLDYIRAKKTLDSINYTTLAENKEFALLNNINSFVNYETGNIKEALTFSNSSAVFFEQNSSLLDSATILAKMDNIFANVRLAKNLQNLKTQAIEEFAKAKLVNNNYLITKGYNLLSYVYYCSYMPNLSKYYNNKALEHYDRFNINDDNLLNRIINSPCEFNKEGLSSFIKKYENRKDKNIKILNKLKLNQLGAFTKVNPYQAQNALDSIFNSAQDSSGNENLFINAYITKYIFYETNDRKAVSEFYIEQAQNILDKSYTSNSHQYIDFYCKLLFYNTTNGVEKTKIEKVLQNFAEFLNRNNLIYPNINCIAYYYNRLLVALLYNEGINEIIKKYGEFYTTHKQLVGDESEFLYDANFLLWMKGYSNIYNSFLNKKTN